MDLNSRLNSRRWRLYPHCLVHIGVLEDGMEHHEQALFALSISSGLCLAAWIWARRRLSSLQASVDQDME
jgi:uncharacterized protein YijF (DUF1287 family)